MKSYRLIYFIVAGFFLGNFFGVFIHNVSAPETIKPFDYVTTYAPKNSFGASEFTEQSVNWSWVNSHVTYTLKRDGVDVTNSLTVNFSTVFSYRKYSYSFTAGANGYFLLTLTFDSKATSSFIDGVNHTVFFNYSDGQLFYNFSDINSVQQIDKTFNLNSNVFIMTVGKNVNKNVKVVLDPTFGYTDTGGTGYIQSATDERLEGSYASPSTSGYADSITFKTASTWNVNIDVQCALYNYVSATDVGTLIATTEIKNSLIKNTVYTFNFSSPRPVLVQGTNYYLLIGSVTDGLNGDCKEVRGTTGTNGYVYKSFTTGVLWSSPLTGESAGTGHAYVYCSYTTDFPPSVTNINPSTGSGCISSPYNLSTLVSDLEGDYNNMTVNYTVQDFPNLTTSLYYQWNNCPNGTYGYEFALSQSTLYKWTSRVNDSLNTVTNTTYFATDCTGGGDCSGIVWVNYTDSNLTLNVSVDKATNTNTTSYSINETNWFWIGENMEITIGIGNLGILLTLLIFVIAMMVDKENLFRPILLFINTPLSLAVGLYYIGNEVVSLNWWIGLIWILLAVLFSFGGLYYGMKFGRK